MSGRGNTFERSYLQNYAPDLPVVFTEWFSIQLPLSTAGFGVCGVGVGVTLAGSAYRVNGVKIGS